MTAALRGKHTAAVEAVIILPRNPGCKTEAAEASQRAGENKSVYQSIKSLICREGETGTTAGAPDLLKTITRVTYHLSITSFKGVLANSPSFSLPGSPSSWPTRGKEGKEQEGK